METLLTILVSLVIFLTIGIIITFLIYDIISTQEIKYIDEKMKEENHGS